MKRFVFLQPFAPCALAAFIIGLSACPKPQPPLDPSDPNATCDTACTNVREMGCTDWVTTPKAGYCSDVCENAAKNAIAWPVGCISAAKSCDEANRCR